jgi:diaminohydroxyphosphoribosylaminopyrimidine deaminase/5-amino-6-(5-phosphoribosylamino)uracil reductase
VDDKFYMRKVLELAKKGSGYTSPNPMVGTVIVKNDRVIAEGYHQRYGEKHAEIMAIDTASESVADAVLYCNLEPCVNGIPNKKTPPCSERIIREKIKRVVIATTDPNSYVNGKGIDLLRQNHVSVDIGTLRDEAIQLNEKYFVYIKNNRPFVHLKIAQSLDGRIATQHGNSKWITNQNALRRVHQWRSEYDAVLVGINTVLKDNPTLNVRLVEGRNPYRILLDDHLQIPLDSHLLTDKESHKTIIFTSKPEDDAKARKLTKQGIQLFHLTDDQQKFMDLKKVLELLANLKITSLLVEGGGEIFTSFIKQKLFDKVSFFIAPMMIGTGVQSVGDLGIESLVDAVKLKNVKIEILDQQAIIEGYQDYDSILV